MPAILIAVLAATAAMMVMALGLPLTLYGGLSDPGAPVEWLQTIAVAGFSFAASGAVALDPVVRWSRARSRPRPRLGVFLASVLWALLAAFVLSLALTVLGTRDAAAQMGVPFWPMLGQALTGFEWAVLTGVLFVPLSICCLLGGLGYAWRRARTARK